MREIFMANRIADGLSTYTDVITARPDLKEGIDAKLIRLGKAELIVE